MIAYKFLADGAVAPFTAFRWPPPGRWVSASSDRREVWIHACRAEDLPYWLEDELWRIELAEPVTAARYQVAAPRARLVERVGAWDRDLAWAYARACALRARDLALPRLPPRLRDALAGETDLEEIAAAAGGEAASLEAGYVADAARNALLVGPSTTSYIAAVVASTIGGGLEAFDAERAWQAAWLAGRLGVPA